MDKLSLLRNLTKRCRIDRSTIAGLTGKEGTIKNVVGDDKKGYQYKVELDEPLPYCQDKLDYYPHWSMVTVFN